MRYGNVETGLAFYSGSEPFVRPSGALRGKALGQESAVQGILWINTVAEPPVC